MTVLACMSIAQLAYSTKQSQELYLEIANIVVHQCFQRNLPDGSESFYHDELLRCLPQFEQYLKRGKGRKKCYTFRTVQIIAGLDKLSTKLIETLIFECAMMILYFVLIQRKSLDVKLYSSPAEMLTKYENCQESFVGADKLPEEEKLKLFHFANFAIIFLEFFENKSRKMEPCMILATILTESNAQKRYAKGGCQNIHLDRREAIYHQESGTSKIPRTPRVEGAQAPRPPDNIKEKWSAPNAEDCLKDMMDQRGETDYQVDEALFQHPHMQVQVVTAQSNDGHMLGKVVKAYSLSSGSNSSSTHLLSGGESQASSCGSCSEDEAGSEVWSGAMYFAEVPCLEDGGCVHLGRNNSLFDSSLSLYGLENYYDFPGNKDLWNEAARGLLISRTMSQTHVPGPAVLELVVNDDSINYAHEAQLQLDCVTGQADDVTMDLLKDVALSSEMSLFDEIYDDFQLHTDFVARQDSLLFDAPSLPPSRAGSIIARTASVMRTGSLGRSCKTVVLHERNQSKRTQDSTDDDQYDAHNKKKSTQP